MQRWPRDFRRRRAIERHRTANEPSTGAYVAALSNETRIAPLADAGAASAFSAGCDLQKRCRHRHLRRREPHPMPSLAVCNARVDWTTPCVTFRRGLRMSACPDTTRGHATPIASVSRSSDSVMTTALRANSVGLVGHGPSGARAPGIEAQRSRGYGKARARRRDGPSSRWVARSWATVVVAGLARGHARLTPGRALRTRASASGSCRSPVPAAAGCARATGCICRRSPSA
jgi:hypothetical protein